MRICNHPIVFEGSDMMLNDCDNDLLYKKGMVFMLMLRYWKPVEIVVSHPPLNPQDLWWWWRHHMSPVPHRALAREQTRHATADDAAIPSSSFGQKLGGPLLRRDQWHWILKKGQKKHYIFSKKASCIVYFLRTDLTIGFGFEWFVGCEVRIQKK